MSPFISLNDITIRIGDKFLFEHTSFTFYKNQQWVIVGPNGSGKSTLAKAIAGLLPLKTGEIICHFIRDKEFPYPSVNKDKIAYISFETQYNTLKKDSLQRDLESYMGVEKKGAIVRDFLGNIQQGLFTIENLLDQELSTLSTGEMRKIFLIKSFLQNPELLILDEPFDGLDIQSKEELEKIISEIMKSVHVILITHREEEIVGGITDVMKIKDGKIEEFGKKDVILGRNEMTTPESQRGSGRVPVQSLPRMTSKNDVLISMKNVTVKYGEKIVLDNISWSVYSGENWAIVGPNGAGKSTLLHLITGDNLQKYANDITVLGNTTYASLWDIKKNVGIVSSNIMLQHTYTMNAYEVILSGFFDSIGLYKSASDQQKKQASEWIGKLHIDHLIGKPYQELSFGQKRIILIARAVVKSPKILILDEPCHGLDNENKQRVLGIIEEIGKSKFSHIILITHDKHEIVPSITRILHVENGKIVDKE